MFIPEGTPRVEILERKSESPITGSTSVSTALFIGPTENGPGLLVNQLPSDLPQRPSLITTWDQYVREFGKIVTDNPNNPFMDGFYMAHAVQGFFANGGKRAYILRLKTAEADDPSSLNETHYGGAFDTLEDFNDAKVIVIPDVAAHVSAGGIQQKLVEHCEKMKDRFAVLDAGNGVHAYEDLKTEVGKTRSDKGYAAFYYPWIEIPNPVQAGQFMFVPPSGHIAGMYARIDNERGVHKAPANEKLRGARDVANRLGDASQAPLHDLGINVLRIFRGDGAINVFGGRTTAPDAKKDFRYINVRRLFIFIEDALKRSLREKLYEPNDPRLWKSLTRTIAEFLTRVQRSGALFGTKPEEAFWIQIDEGNNPESERRLGVLNIRIGVRPNYPAEYIVVNIGIWDGQVTVQET
jgi:hypothetical protein